MAISTTPLIGKCRVLLTTPTADSPRRGRSRCRNRLPMPSGSHTPPTATTSVDVPHFINISADETSEHQLNTAGWITANKVKVIATSVKAAEHVKQDEKKACREAVEKRIKAAKEDQHRGNTALKHSRSKRKRR